MFRSARWRSDKNKIKAVFKLQFYVTEVRKSGVDALVLSIIPGDVGKPTTKLEKATVREGICRWENPVYETVKFIQDPKSGKINEKIYYFVVSTGLPKSSCIGEVSVDFADYAEAMRPSSLSLPFKNSHSNAVLHVSIQRLQEKGDQREEEQCEDAKIDSHETSLRTYLSNRDTNESIKSYSAKDISSKAIEDRAILSPLTSSESDMTLSSSDGSSGLDTPRELGNTNIHQNPKVFEEHQKSHWQGSAVSEHNLSADNSTSGSHDALPGERSQQASDKEINRLKTELAALARQVDVSELEIQTLRKQIVKESKRGQDLSKENISLKEERDVVKIECDNLRSFHKRMDESKLRSRSQFEGADLQAFVEEIRQELDYEKDLNANLQLQLQKTQESNAELLLAVQDLDQMLEQKNREICNLYNKNEPSGNSQELKGKASKCETDDDEEQKVLQELVKEQSNAKETHLLEQKVIDLYGEIEIYRKDKDELEMQMEQLALDYEILKQENHEIAYKLEQSQLQEQLKMQYECSSPVADANDLLTHIQSLENELRQQSEDYSNSLVTIKELEAHVRKLDEELKKQAQGFQDDLEAMTREKVTAVNDLETHVESLENELKKQSDEHSVSLATITELEICIRRLEEELEQQAQGFEADLEAVTRDKVEQEQRAIQAEEALRKARLKNANTAERLQEEFRRLSGQMASTFDANEKAAMRAITEARELRAQKSLLEEMLEKVKEELQSVKADHEVKLNELSNEINMMTVQIGEMLLEIEDKSRQIEHQKKHEEQISRVFSEETHMLKAEIESLHAEIISLSKQVEQKEVLRTDFEVMRKSVEESEILLQKGTVERNELVSTIALLKKEAAESFEKLNRMRHLKDEYKAATRLFKSESEAFRAQYRDLKHSMVEDEAEKERLRNQVFQLEGDLKKKDDELTDIEKKLKDNDGCPLLSDGNSTMTVNKESTSIDENSNEITSLGQKIKKLEDLIKSKETALEISTTSFLEKEKELQNKIEELESRVEEFNQCSALQKVIEDGFGEARNAEEHLSNIACATEDTVSAMPCINSDSDLPEKEQKTISINKGDSNSCDVTELASLKEKNNWMESELKELQERYSEMSVKFAEVEGERQKLMMTVRSLKNAHKA